MATKNSKHILFTGGGSAGHVTPNLALIKRARELGWKVSYAGSVQGIERTLTQPWLIPYYPVATGKLSRQFTWKTFLTPINVLRGIWQAYKLCKQIKPDVVFSKGGFVAVPIVIGAWLNHIPVIAHESDLTPGLANRLCYPFVKKIALSFPQSERYFNNKKKLVYTGTPVREAMLNGNAEHGKIFLNFKTKKPLLLIYGGGLGAATVNRAIRNIILKLLTQFNIVHCCGKGKTEPALNHIEGYRQFAYLDEELPHVMAAADIVISRAGANSIYELLSLHKPHLLIPLSKKSSRGDQIENAQYFADLGLSLVLTEEDLTADNFILSIQRLWHEKDQQKKRLEAYALPDARAHLIQLIAEAQEMH